MIPVFGRPRWGDHELEATLGYIGKTVKMKRKKGRLRVRSRSSSYTKADTVKISSIRLAKSDSGVFYKEDTS